MRFAIVLGLLLLIGSAGCCHATAGHLRRPERPEIKLPVAPRVVEVRDAQTGEVDRVEYILQEDQMRDLQIFLIRLDGYVRQLEAVPCFDTPPPAGSVIE
jgi:hypothetical protein